MVELVTEGSERLKMPLLLLLFLLEQPFRGRLVPIWLALSKPQIRQAEDPGSIPLPVSTVSTFFPATLALLDKAVLSAISL